MAHNIYMLGKAAKQAEAQNYPEACGVNVADRWKERLRSYLGYRQLMVITSFA